MFNLLHASNGEQCEHFYLMIIKYFVYQMTIFSRCFAGSFSFIMNCNVVLFIIKYITDIIFLLKLLHSVYVQRLYLFILRLVDANFQFEEMRLNARKACVVSVDILSNCRKCMGNLNLNFRVQFVAVHYVLDAFLVHFLFGAKVIMIITECFPVHFGVHLECKHVYT